MKKLVLFFLCTHFYFCAFTQINEEKKAVVKETAL